MASITETETTHHIQYLTQCTRTLERFVEEGWACDGSAAGPIGLSSDWVDTTECRGASCSAILRDMGC